MKGRCTLVDTRIGTPLDLDCRASNESGNHEANIRRARLHSDVHSFMNRKCFPRRLDTHDRIRLHRVKRDDQD